MSLFSSIVSAIRVEITRARSSAIPLGPGRAPGDSLRDTWTCSRCRRMFLLVEIVSYGTNAPRCPHCRAL